MPISEASGLDANGRCCGRKPMVYKSKTSTSTGPHRFCPKCDRAFNLESGHQIDNWAWKHNAQGQWIKRPYRKGQ